MDIVSSLHDLLAAVPLQNGASFLRGEHREDQMGIVGLPGQCLGFVQRETKQMLVRRKLALEFGEKSLLRRSDAGAELSESGNTGGGGTVSEMFGCLNELHNVFPLVVVCLVKLMDKKISYAATFSVTPNS